MPSGSASGMPGNRFHRYARGGWHRFHRYAGGSSIENAKGPGIALQMGILNAKGSCIGNAKGSVIGSTSMPRRLSFTSFLGYLIARLRAIVQSDCRTACNHTVGLYQGFSVDCGTLCNRAIRLQDCV